MSVAAAARVIVSSPRRGSRPRPRARRVASTSGETSASQPRPWAVSLARVFEWEDILEVAGDDAETRAVSDDDDDDAPTTSGSNGPERGCKDEFIVIDGANVAWGLAQKLKSKFHTKSRVPMSSAVLMALNHEPWRRRGIRTHAFIPREYVIGYVNSVCDGGGLATVNAECVEYLGKGMWCNRRLMDEVDKGRLTLVSRAGEDGRGSRKADDLVILQRAKEADAWICSNDKFRDHRRERNIGFAGGKALKEFARLRRIDHNFLIAPGLDDETLQAMTNASDWSPRCGASFFDAYDGPSPRLVGSHSELDPFPPHAAPPDLLPITFEPIPTDAMKTARAHFLARRLWEVSRVRA